MFLRQSCNPWLVALIAAPSVVFADATRSAAEQNQPWLAWISIVISVVVLLWIVSELYGQRRNLRHAREASRIRVVLDELPEGIIIVDKSGKITWMSESTHRLFGWSAASAKGLGAADLVHPDDRVRVLERMTEIGGMPGALELVEFRFRTAEGSHVPVECTVRNLGNVEGIEGLLISGRDLTERSVARHQLEAAKLNAERVLAEKNEFLAILGHEVRTPLQAIYAALDVVLRQIPSGDDSREVVESATRSAESLLHTLDDLLVMSRAEAKLAPVRRVAFDPLALAQEIVGLFDVPARKKGGSLRAVFGESTPRMVGDPARIRQILSNLVGNAVRYAGHTEIEIGFQENKAADGTEEAVWEVRDRGPGLQEGDASRLFRKWERGREDVPGSGLGLAIVADMVESMKGSLLAFPREGGGLVVRLRFPLVAPEQLGSDPHLEMQVPRLARPAGRMPRVLVAEDDRTNQVVIRKQLAGLGCEATIMADGSLALAKYDEEPFDLILLDCQMPVMDGFEAARQIRRREDDKKRPRTPILAVTAWAMQEDQALCLESGMDEVLTKPLRPAELSDALFRWIGYRKEGA